MNHFPVALLLIIGALLRPSESFRFEIQAGKTRCISEDITGETLTVGKYAVVNPLDDQPLPESHKVTVRLLSSHGNTYHSADNVASGQFAFTTRDKGEHSACFWTVEHNPPATLTVEFDWKSGVASRDWSTVAKKGNIDLMNYDLKKLEDTLTDIRNEMFYLRDREDEMQELNRSTNSKMAWMSFLSLAICLSVAGLQVWHLKTFFEKKKLI